MSRTPEQIVDDERRAVEADELRRVARALGGPNDAAHRAPADVLLAATAREAIARGDVDRAAEVVALMSDEERAKWQAPVAEAQARQAEAARQQAIRAALEAGDEATALALMTPEEQESFEARGRANGKAER